VARAIADVIADLEELQGKSGDATASLKAVQESFQKKVAQQAKGTQPVAQSKELAAAEAKLKSATEALAKAHEQAQATEQERSRAQAELQAATEALGKLDAAVAAVQVEIARWQAQAEDLAAEVQRELRIELSQLANDLKLSDRDNGGPTAWEEKIQRLKDQVAQAGGIDPEIADEYRQVKQRCDFLSTQTEDLNKALDELQKVVRELDKVIDKQFHANFKKITDQFSHYFKALFGGGRATLELVTLQEEAADDSETDESVQTQNIASPAAEKNPLSRMGINIDACPPGKKVNAVQALSGGERTLLSTALLCAIVACNPSPFVIMDEVDAALDEANAERLATIFHELNKGTQIIVITHNRVIMQHADVLYGVTMSPEGDSRVLSVSLRDAEKIPT
jgi:chromosome segregation protein